jgi:hypothetical protein
MCATDFLCNLIGGIVDQQLRGRLSVAILANGAPSLQDMMPGSPFLTTLNSTPETFARASIETDIGNRWAIARMIGDGRSDPMGLLTDLRPAGDAWVTMAEYTYRTAQTLQMPSLVALFYRDSWGNGVNCAQSGYMAQWMPCTSPVPADGGSLLSWWQQLLALNTFILTTVIVETMNAIDHAWDHATTRKTNGTDGLIHLSSQRYPDVPGSFAPERYRVQPPSADSHSGQLNSPSTFLRAVDAVRLLSTRNP